MSSSRVQMSLTGRLAAGGLEDVRGLDQVVRLRIGTAAEGAAGVEHLDAHLLRRQPEHAGDGLLIDGLELLAVDDAHARAVGRSGVMTQSMVSMAAWAR
jgi:hypothetical protein